MLHQVEDIHHQGLDATVDEINAVEGAHHTEGCIGEKGRQA